MKNLRMFRKVCSEKGLGSVVLATAMWSLCPKRDAVKQEGQLTTNNDLWKYLVGKGARIFRHDPEEESGQEILDYLINRAQKVTLDIQHEMVDQGMKLGETGAGREVQEELEKLKEKHEKEMHEIRRDMKKAIKEKDEERQDEIRLYQAQIDDQIRAAEKQARDLEMGREELRRQMRDEHAREIAELKADI